VTLTLAATSTNVPGMSAILLVGFILFVTLGYTVRCWVRPFTDCHRCHGTGDTRRRLTDRLRYGHRPRPRAARGRPACPRCRGTGLRLRLGRRAYNHLTRVRRAAR
jgi:hypothetical protein